MLKYKSTFFSNNILLWQTKQITFQIIWTKNNSEQSMQNSTYKVCKNA